MRRIALAAATAICLSAGMFIGVRAASSSGLWLMLPALPSAHNGHTSTLLSDGKILVTGGALPRLPTDTSALTVSRAAELYRPETNDWLTVSPMLIGRWMHGAALLTANDKVLVAGGLDVPVRLEFTSGPDCGLSGLPATPTAMAELFDPSTLTWSATLPMHEARGSFTLVRLFDGRILAAGGSFSRQAEIYDPATNEWQLAETMGAARTGAAYTLMFDGRVMVAGGNFGALWPFCDTKAEIYDPVTNWWTPTNDMSVDRRFATATPIKLPDGTRRVLVAGGFDVFNGTGVLSSAELYDPATNQWTLTGSMTEPRSRHTATLMGDGRVLVTGGFTTGGGDLASAEIYDPATETWMAVNGMSSGRSGHTATLLSNPFTQVAVIGGSSGFLSAELFQPTPLGSSTAMTATACQPIRFNATVSSASAVGRPTGQVTFKDGATTLGIHNLDEFGEASILFVSPLAPGVHTFTAEYTGDDAFATSTGSFTESLSARLSVSIDGNFAAQPVGTSVTLTASISGGAGPFTYAWKRNGVTVSTSTSATLTETPPFGTNIYTVTVTDASGCISESATKEVDVVDPTAPSVIATVSGTAGANGWYISDVSVTWTVSDPDSPITSTSGCAPSSITSDTAATSVTCSATSGGGTTTKTVVIKRDVTRPTLTLVSPAPVNANQPGGAIVTFTASASDNVDPNPIISCVPLSGSLFAAGQTTVTCTATNAAGLSASGTLTVTVVGSAQQTSDLITVVASLPPTPGGSLGTKLQQILANINSGNTAGACTTLRAFLNEVSAQSGKTISAADAARLTQAAQTIQSSLGCS